MTNKIIDDIDLDFDARNHRELSPILFFTEQSINYYTQNSSQSFQTQDSSHTPFINRIIYELESSIFSDKYYGDDKEEINDYNKSILTSLKDTINTDNQDPSVEYQFGLPYEIVSSQMSSLRYFTSKLKKLLKRDFKQMPISTARFPHFHQQTSNYFFYDDLNSNDNDNFQQDETKLNEIFAVGTGKKDAEYLISLEKLNEFYIILYQHRRAFSLSPTFVISILDSLNTILDSLFAKKETHLDENAEKNDFQFFNRFRNFLNEVSNEEEKVTKSKYFKLIMLIKIRLYLIIQRMYDCFLVLLQFIIMEQEQISEDIKDDRFSFKKLFNESLPETNKRSKIIKDVSSDQILDFCFSSNGNNDFILTKEGVFKINDKENGQISVTRINFKEEQQNRRIINDARIAFYNGILYFLSVENKTIRKILVSSPNDEIPMNKKESKRPEAKEKEEEKNKKIKHKNKKLREQQRKEKKRQRRNERCILEKVEANLENISINISDEYPIVSMNVYENYVRILQKINDNKFIFTNIDLTPNSRINYDVVEAFKECENDQKNSQTSTEIEINNEKYKVTNACFSKDFIFFSFEDSSFEQWMIFRNGKSIPFKHLISPFLFHSYSRYKMDNDLFLHVIEPIFSNESTCVNKMYLKETKHYIRSESEVFLNYPYLQKVSDIVDNCSQFIINREVSKKITTEEFYKIKERNDDDEDEEEKKKKKILNQAVDPFSFSVSPEEMSCVIQSLTSISNNLEHIKSLIDELKDDKLKHFFASLMVKMCGINFLYGTVSYYSSKDQMSQGVMNGFKKFKEFILGLFESTKSNSNINYDIMIRESLIFTFTIASKFLFLPDCFNELHEFMNKLFHFNESGYEIIKRLFNSLSAFIFTYPSSLYFIDNSIYNQLIEYEEIINLQELYSKSLFNIAFERRFSEKVIKPELISSIDKYFESLFQYIKYILLNESNTLNKVEVLFSILFGFPIKNCFYSLMVQKHVTEITPLFYDRVRKMQGVNESDQQFLNGYRKIQQQTVHKEIKVIESEHPYKLTTEKTEKNEKTKSKKSKRIRLWKKSNNVVEELGIIEFDLDVDFIYCIFDSRCEIPHGYSILISDNHSQISIGNKDFRLNQAYLFKSSALKVKLTSDGENKNDNNGANWGYKINFVGVSFDNPYYWISSVHLNFYNCFISFLTSLFHSSFQSTPYSKNEKEFNFILNNKIIQGIKFEDIENYEESLKQNKETSKPIKRTLTRGISRGISYDIENESLFDDDFKKAFINDLLTLDENSKTRGKQLIDLLYAKTAKQNRIKLNESTKSILVIERYLAACLFKQLGLINLCLKFINNINDIDIEIPNRLKLVWKMVYLLRKTLFFSYQKSKVELNSNSLKLNFKLFSEEIKRKCILLLYSDPILKFKDDGDLNDDTIESTAKSIFSFVTSEIRLSNISDLIDIRRKRLSISSQAVNYLSSFIEKDLFFESSKLIFVREFNHYHVFYQYSGVTQAELEDFNKLYGSLTVKIVKIFYSSNPTFALISNHSFLNESLFKHNDNESRNECARIFIDTLEKVEQDKTFSREYTNFVIICILLSIAAENKNNEILDYVINLLLLNDIDFQCKRLILTTIPVFYQLTPDNQKLNDKSLLDSILLNNRNSPVMIRSLFYWLSSSIINKNDSSSSSSSNSVEFITKVLKGIGQSFIGQSCLFIDDSFKPYTHRQVAEGMISFIRLLTNSRNETMMAIIHDVLTNVIGKIKFDDDDDGIKDELMISIGLFASIGQILSSFESERRIIKDDSWKSIKTIIGYNTSFSLLREYDDSNKKVQGGFTNAVLFDPKKVDLTDNEIENIIQLHEVISNSKYFIETQNYGNSISNIQIAENILISTFYSFLPVIMQNKNNADLLLKNKRSLSLFEFATKLLPSNENTVVILSHYLEQAINSPLCQVDSNDELNKCDKNGGFRFMKANFGEIAYNENESDLIKTNRDHDNLFICSRPFKNDCQIYFEVKINKIGSNQIFIGFIDSCEFKLNRAFGFGCTGHANGFSRKSHYLAKKNYQNGDVLMQKEWLNETGSTLSDNEYSDSEEDYEDDENDNNCKSSNNDLDAFSCHDQKLVTVVSEIFKQSNVLAGRNLTKTVYCLYRIASKMADICEQGIPHHVMDAKLIKLSQNFEPDLSQITSESNDEDDLVHDVFWAPELLESFEMNEQSDVYSFAVIAYLMFTGRFPFHHKSMMLLERMVRANKRDVIPDSVPPLIKELIEACWDHSPILRPSFKVIAESLIDPSNTIEGLDRNELESLIANGSSSSNDNNNNNDNNNDNNNSDNGTANANEQKAKSVYSLNDGDRIGCFYTSEYLYLTLNGKLTPYRLFHTSINSYVPIIFIDHDEIELEIVQNATVVDSTNDKFDFLNIEKVPDKYFESKDIKKPAKIGSIYTTAGDVKEKKHLIGQQVYITKTISNENKAKMETIESVTPELYRYHENYGIIKEITPIENNKFVSKLKIETYDNNSLSKTIISTDSRYIKGIKTNFFNLIENQTNTKLSFNKNFDLKYLPKELQNSRDFKSIKNYLKSKTIKDNSKSIAIIMTRYLVFVLTDYLRFIKSPLIQDNENRNDNSNDEVDKILNGLVASIPTITSFRPKFIYEIENDGTSNYIIFNDDDKEKNSKDDYYYKIPGFTKIYNKSFGLFLKLSEQFISSKFISKILQLSIEKAVRGQIYSPLFLYENIPSSNKLESFSPLPSQFCFKNSIKYSKLDKNRIIGYMPILIDSIPDILPSVKCGRRRLRKSSEEVTYIDFNVDVDVDMKWKYSIQEIKKMKMKMKKNCDIDFDSKEYQNYKLKFGVLTLSKNLPEYLLNNSLGFIQIVFNVFQSFNRSDKYYDKLKDFLSNEFLEKFFALAMRKDPLVYPFIQVIIVTLISRYGFSDSLFQHNADNASFVFGNQFDKLFKIDEFPSSSNELPLLFSIYFNLIQTKISELLSNDRHSIFQKYEKLNKELFLISDVEIGKNEKKFLECEINDETNRWRRYRYHDDDDDNNKNNKKKNFRSFYLVYYYSYLLNSDGKLPYPMFLFMNEWMMQHFGGFRTTVSKKDINGFKVIQIDDDAEIVYRSDVFQNDCDLTCSCQLINIYNESEGDEDNSYDSLEYDLTENEQETNENEQETNENEQQTNAKEQVANNNEQEIEENEHAVNENGQETSKSEQAVDANEQELNSNSSTPKSAKSLKNKKHKKESYKVFIHQLNDDKQIEITDPESIAVVSFPLEIFVVHEKGESNKKTKLKMGDVYIVSFGPSEKDKEDCFLSNYDKIQKDFEDFVKLSKYDNLLYDSHNSKLNITASGNATSSNANRGNGSNSASNESQNTDTNASNISENTNQTYEDVDNSNNNRHDNENIVDDDDDDDENGNSNNENVNAKNSNESASQVYEDVDNNNNNRYDNESANQIYEDVDNNNNNRYDNESANQIYEDVDNNNNNKFDNESAKQIYEDVDNNNNILYDNENLVDGDDDDDVIEIDADDYDNETTNADANDTNDDVKTNDYQVYAIEKIPTTLSVSIPSLPSSISERIFSLRYSIITRYSRLIESMMLNYRLSDDDRNGYSGTNWWSSSTSISSSSRRPPSQYLRQIIGPAYSMKTESKFRFINNLLKNEKKEDSHLKLIFNRFEQQKFLNCVENRKETSSSLISARPLFVQLMEQVDINSISQLKVRGAPPFNVKLVGEGAIDGGGPSREIFSSLIIEMMNKHLGIFTFNPNRCHKNIETNQEDLIPNKEAKLSDDFNDDFVHLLSRRFTFAGALIACCIISSLPQPMKLSSIVWDYLSRESVSIESVYEVDSNFKELIENCEELQNSSLTEAEFKERFNHTFEIQNSFDKLIEIAPSGSKIIVTKENLSEFIQLAKNSRLHEFDHELKEIKEGFDKIMSYKNITSILHPNELKLLVCGEPNCSIEQMKKLTDVSAPYTDDAKFSKDNLIRMFWNVMQKFTPDERMQFIRFSTGNLGLPAPGLKWDKKLTVDISSRSEKEENGKKMLFGSTCSSRVDIPFYESEDELEKMIRMSLKFAGIISDNEERFEEVPSEFL